MVEHLFTFFLQFPLSIAFQRGIQFLSDAYQVLNVSKFCEGVVEFLSEEIGVKIKATWLQRERDFVWWVMNILLIAWCAAKLIVSAMYKQKLVYQQHLIWSIMQNLYLVNYVPCFFVSCVKRIKVNNGI